MKNASPSPPPQETTLPLGAELRLSALKNYNVGEKVNLLNNTVDICPYVLDPSKRHIRLLRNILISHINDTMRFKNIYNKDDDAATNKGLNSRFCDIGGICLKRDTANERIIIVSNYDDNQANYLTSYLELDY